MDDLNDKITGNSLSAQEWNQPASEIQTAIQDSEQTLSGADLTQLSKAISSYSAASDFYACGGTANSYILTTIGNYKSPQVIREGMKFRFYPNVNGVVSTAQITLPGGLGTKNVVRPDGLAFLAAEDFNVNEMAEVVYRSGSDRLELKTRNSNNVANNSSVSGLRVTDALNTLNTLFANIDTDDVANATSLNGGVGTLSDVLNLLNSQTGSVNVIGDPVGQVQLLSATAGTWSTVTLTNGVADRPALVMFSCEQNISNTTFYARRLADTRSPSIVISPPSYITPNADVFGQLVGHVTGGSIGSIGWKIIELNSSSQIQVRASRASVRIAMSVVATY